MTPTPELLWRPDPSRVAASRMTAFRAWLREHRGVDVPDYPALWAWSTADVEGFWGALAEFLEVRFHTPPSQVLGTDAMPGAEWFPRATLNYAEHSLAEALG